MIGDGAETGPIIYLDQHGDRQSHWCAIAPGAIRRWLDRQRLLGLISAEGIATVEKLIAEVG